MVLHVSRSIHPGNVFHILVDFRNLTIRILDFCVEVINTFLTFLLGVKRFLQTQKKTGAKGVFLGIPKWAA